MSTIFNHMVKYKDAAPTAEATLNKVFAALADANRRQLIHLLTEGEQRVSDLAKHFSMSLVAVSKHLKVLEAAGIVRRRVDGRTHYLSLNPEQLTAALDWIAVYRNFWQQRLDQLDKLEE